MTESERLDAMKTVVSRGVIAFSDLDGLIASAIAAVDPLVSVISDGVALSMVPGIAGKKMIYAARALSASLAAIGLDAAELHSKCTAVAQANNVDSGALTQAAGVTILSGGDR